MEIVEELFKLTSVDNESPMFDLELLYTINKGKSNERKEFKNAGFGLTLFTAIKKIAHYMVELNHQDEAIKLKTYFKEYQQNLDNLKDLIYGKEGSPG